MLLVFAVRIVLDGYNPVAGYLNSDVAKGYDLALIVFCAILAVQAVHNQRS